MAGEKQRPMADEITHHTIAKGLDLPIAGRPIQVVRGDTRVTRVAVMADDFPGMKPGMQVAEGDTVKRGQPLFEDRKTPGVLHTAPGAGRVIGVYRGARRALQSVVIDLSDGERAGTPDDSELQRFEGYAAVADRAPAELSRDQVQALLIESGLWTALRRRPFERTADPASPPAALFVTAMDTNPLAPLPEIAIEAAREDFERGLQIVSKLCEGPTYLCVDPTSGIDKGVEAPVEVRTFSGPHPAGTVGVHIHLLRPASRETTVWHLGYQDVISIGRLFASGRLPVQRVISVAGPVVADPRLVTTRVGACLDDVLADLELAEGELRHVSGSVLSGKKAMGENFGFMGRFDNQVSVLAEDREKEFIGWLTPGLDSFSIIPIYVSNLLTRLFGERTFDLTTSTHGSRRAMVPIGLYEDVMPMDILPTFLLRSLLVGDVERAEQLGALELAEEDLALCTFVCPGKHDYGPVLRRNLEIIEKEG